MQVRNNILAVAEEAGKIHCNTEVTHTNKIGDLPGYSDPVWYNPKCGSLHPVTCPGPENHLVTYNSQGRN